MPDESLAWKVTKFFGRLAGRAIGRTAKFTWDHKEQIARSTAAAATAGAGLVKGTAEFAYNTGSLLYYDKKKLDDLENKIKAQSKKYHETVSKNQDLIDAGIIGGTTLAHYIMHDDSIPDEVIQAYNLAYPNVAEQMSFTEAAEQYNPEQLQGFLAGIKGKLFEIKYQDYLNDGNLPEGYTAMLAESPNQQGWDIAIQGPDSQIAEVLQLKASDSVDYITAAARQYPDIDIVTTDEVHSQILMHASAESFVNSEISSAALEQTLEHAAEPGYDFSDMIDIKLPLASLALIAFTEYTEKDKSVYQKSFSFGDRSSKSIIAYTAGGIIGGITQTWWIGLLTAVGTRYIAGKGQQRRLEFKKLDKLSRINDRVIERYLGLSKA